MISNDCDDEWLKLDLTIPYPTPQPFEFSQIPQRARIFCRRPPDATPPPPDPMEIEYYPTPAQARQPVSQDSQPRNETPLFIPEDDCTSARYGSFPFGSIPLTPSSWAQDQEPGPIRRRLVYIVPMPRTYGH